MIDQIDVHVSIGSVPYREVPHPEAPILARVLAREGVRGAWVGNLPSAFAAQPHSSHDPLFDALAPHPELRATPVVHPAVRGWERALEHARERGAAAVRAYPAQWRLGPAGSRMRALAGACAAAKIPIMLTAHLEPQAGDVFRPDGADTIRAILRAHAAVRLIVLAADRALVESSYVGLSPEEARRLWWDISRIAGPPVDDLSALLRARGGAQFLYGSGWPLRLTQVPKANLELLPAELSEVPLADADAVGAPRPRT